jgi:hypothetical protein
MTDFSAGDSLGHFVKCWRLAESKDRSFHRCSTWNIEGVVRCSTWNIRSREPETGFSRLLGDLCGLSLRPRRFQNRLKMAARLVSPTPPLVYSWRNNPSRKYFSICPLGDLCGLSLRPRRFQNRLKMTVCLVSPTPPLYEPEQPKDHRCKSPLRSTIN